MKRSVCFVLISILVLCSLGAGESITVSWKDTGDNSSIYRWKTANSDWTVTNEEEISYTVERNKGEVFQIQSSFDGEVWSSSHLVAVVPYEGSSAIFSWDNSDTFFLYYRWREEDGEWNLSQSETNSEAVIPLEEGKHTIEIAFSNDGEKWSSSLFYPLTVLKAPKEVRNTQIEMASSFSLSYGIFDFYNGHHIEDARYLTTTDSGFSLGLELALPLGERWRLYGLYSYSRENKKTTVIPDAFMVEHHQFGLGIDMLFPIKSWRLFVGPSLKYSVDINGGYWSPSVFLGTRGGVEYFLTEKVYVGMETGLSLAYNSAEDPLMRSLTYLINPVGIRMGVKF